MNRIARLLVLVAALASSFAVTSSTAGAVTWHNTGSEAFHAIGGPLTLTVGSNTFSCSGSTVTGTSPIGTFATTYSMTATLVYSPCVVASVQYYLHCNSTFTGVAWAAGPPAVTANSVDMTCNLNFSGTVTSLCHLSGSTPATYTNPFGTLPGRITFLTSSTLTVTNGAMSCFLGTGTGTWS